MKWRALRLDTGNYSWGSEAVTRKTRILDVVYNASNNELVRTQTLVKSAIVQVDAAPFKQWYLTHYGVDIGRKKKAPAAKKDAAEVLFIVAKCSVPFTTHLLDYLFVLVVLHKHQNRLFVVLFEMLYAVLLYCFIYVQISVKFSFVYCPILFLLATSFVY